MDRSARIAWTADGLEAIHVYAPRRSDEELADFARGVADEALLNRTVHDLVAALRRLYDGTFEVQRRVRGGGEARLHITLHPPRGTPNPDY